MFEGIVVGFFVFAAGYVVLMRVMARRADVLHGEFIQPTGPSSSVSAASLLSRLQRYVDGLRPTARL
jgi:hypothetical protein